MFDESVAPYDLICLALSDKGRNVEGKHDILFEKLDTFNEIMSRPFVQGRDLIDAGLSPDKSFTDILDYSHKLRLAGVNKDDALAQTVAYARKQKSSK